MNFNPVEATIQDMQAAMQSGSLTSYELVLLYLERVGSIDKDGSRLNSVLEINPDALLIAEALDNERKLQGARGPLHGIPILLKDNINTGDKMHTSAGSLALANSYAPEDAFLVKQLRKAGAVILGKVNMTELANYMTEGMPNGYSSRGGQVVNPYGAAFDTSGSSSGSAVAVAASLCAATVGTETCGSILSPSTWNSIVGIKPTVGLISRTGIVPIAVSQDTAGPMARTVADAATLLGALTGIDPADPATHTGTGRIFTDYMQFLNHTDLSGFRIGIARGHFHDESGTEEASLFEEAVTALRSLGAIVADGIDIPQDKELSYWSVLKYEFKACMNAYLASLGPTAPVRSLKEIIVFNEAHGEAALKYGQTLLVDSEATSGTLTEPEYLRDRAKDLRLCRSEGIDRVLKEYELNALLFPGVMGCNMAARAGYPSIAVPAGYTPEGRPVGITFCAGAYSEPVLISIAHAFEQATKKRVPPKV